MEKPPQAPGLRWRDGKPMWRASKAAIRAGYPVKSANLSALADDPAALQRRCLRLQAEMREWIGGTTATAPAFNGTIARLLSIYQTADESPYHKLKPSSRHPYDVYARMLTVEVGARRIDACDGRDLRRWFRAWSAPNEPEGKPKLAAARMAITVLKSALSFGKTCRMPGCADLKSILEEIEFPTPAPRTGTATADQVIAARAAARAAGHAPAALAYALQYEASLRQWDVIGEWIPLSDPRPSVVVSPTSKWIGPMWSQIDEHSVLRLTPGKTEDSSAMRVLIPLHECPMVVEELATVPQSARSGPLIVNPRTGLPYRQIYYRDVWHVSAKTAGIPKSVWNRDLRASGITEAREAGAPTDDVAKTAGHSDKRTTARVYDRDTLEAARRVSRARTAHRAKTNDR